MLNHLTAIQLSQLEALPFLYKHWNEKINVISRKDIEYLPIHHIKHSLAIAKFIHFKDGSQIMDIGTGGGFPGIPLAIAFPQVEFTLVDSIGKKIKVVESIASEIGLKNVTATNQRAETINGLFDFIVSRATAPMNDLVKWSQYKISKMQKNALPNGIIALKGGDLSTELQPFNKKITLVPLSQYFTETYFESKFVVYLPL
jgi:16S rRNA (guanine527-N7)-methyltransferase